MDCRVVASFADGEEEGVVVRSELELEEYEDDEGDEGEGKVDFGLEAFMAAQSAKDVHERHLVLPPKLLHR